MNILFFHSITIDPTKGGIERVTKTLADEFTTHNNAVYYIAAKRTWENSCDTSRQFFLPNEKKLCSSENAAFFEKFLKEKQIDGIIFQWADGKRFPFPKITKKLYIPIIAVIHTDPCFYEQRFRGNGIFMRIKRFLRFRRQAGIYRWNAKYCAKTVLLSEIFFPKFLKHFQRNKKPIVCAIPNPSTYESVPVKLSEKKKELLFVGRLEMAVKQPQLLLKIWQKIQAKFPDWSLRIVGGGFDESEVRELARTLQLKRVFFEGFQNPKKYYENAAIFCMTSAYEGFGMVLIEATAHACVPVTFDSFSAVHDIIQNEKNGILVPAFDCDKYAEELVKLMSDTALRERLAIQAQKDVEKFSAQKIATSWLNILVTEKNNKTT